MLVTYGAKKLRRQCFNSHVEETSKKIKEVALEKLRTNLTFAARKNAAARARIREGKVNLVRVLVVP